MPRWAGPIGLVAMSAVVLIAFAAIVFGLGPDLVDREAGTVVPAFAHRIVDDDTLTIITETGEGDFTRITDVTETASAVRITIRSMEAPGLRVSQGRILELTVELEAPLGHRVVHDGIHEVPLEQ